MQLRADNDEKEKAEKRGRFFGRNNSRAENVIERGWKLYI
jgi:hypothetical protein